MLLKPHAPYIMKSWPRYIRKCGFAPKHAKVQYVVMLQMRHRKLDVNYSVPKVGRHAKLETLEKD